MQQADCWRDQICWFGRSSRFKKSRHQRHPLFARFLLPLLRSTATSLMKMEISWSWMGTNLGMQVDRNDINPGVNRSSMQNHENKKRQNNKIVKSENHQDRQPQASSGGPRWLGEGPWSESTESTESHGRRMKDVWQTRERRERIESRAESGDCSGL